VTRAEEHILIEARRYKFCPWCASALVEKEHDGRARLICPNCDFVWYHNPIPAAGAIIYRDGKILLVKRKYPPRIGDWTFPAGFMEYDESPVDCCIREIKEETGLDIKVTRLFWNYAGHDDPRSNAVLALYIAEIIGGIITPGDDAAEVKFFTLDKTPSNIAFKSHKDAIVDFKEYLNIGKFPIR
jgi:8-oxo-dGTP diphosphatase